MIWSLSRRKSDSLFLRKKSPFHDLSYLTAPKISTVLSADFHSNRQLLNTPQGKFFDIYKANKDPKIKQIIEKIDDIFELERNFRKENLNAEQIHKARHTKAYLDVLNGYFNHLETQNYSTHQLQVKPSSTV